jgi:hypothetical protein
MFDGYDWPVLNRKEQKERDIDTSSSGYVNSVQGSHEEDVFPP